MKDSRRDKMTIDDRYEHNDAVWHTEVNTNIQSKQVDDVEADVQDDIETLDELHGPRSWLHPAIASAIFCFFPTGIIAVIQARKAMNAYDSGDLHAWVRYTARARVLVFLTCFLGLIVYGAIIGVIHAITNTGNG
ncbi:glucose import in response to insulin stimulus [Mactra antiquata]